VAGDAEHREDAAGDRQAFCNRAPTDHETTRYLVYTVRSRK